MLFLNYNWADSTRATFRRRRCANINFEIETNVANHLMWIFDPNQNLRHFVNWGLYLLWKTPSLIFVVVLVANYFLRFSAKNKIKTKIGLKIGTNLGTSSTLVKISRIGWFSCAWLHLIDQHTYNTTTPQFFYKWVMSCQFALFRLCGKQQLWSWLVSTNKVICG